LSPNFKYKGVLAGVGEGVFKGEADGEIIGVEAGEGVPEGDADGVAGEAGVDVLVGVEAGNLHPFNVKENSAIIHINTIFRIHIPSFLFSPYSIA
jgi:hypothetical protein